MIDYYFKFESEEAAKTALIGAGFERGEDDNIYHLGCAVDWVGAITRQVGGTNDDPLYESAEGYHVNVRAWVEIELPVSFSIQPITPARVWA